MFGKLKEKVKPNSSQNRTVSKAPPTRKRPVIVPESTDKRRDPDSIQARYPNFTEEDIKRVQEGIAEHERRVKEYEIQRCIHEEIVGTFRKRD